MEKNQASWLRIGLIWGALATVLAVPIIAATMSPQLQWRDFVYIVAGLAGVIAMSLMLVQPLLISEYLPGLSPKSSRRIHRWIGGILVAGVVIHIGGLWLTSPPDVVDALLFASPTSFSIWGVVAMWAIFATAILALLRKRLHIKLRTWRFSHIFLAALIVVSTVVHALMIEGTMEVVSKAALCSLVILATAKVIIRQLR